MLIRFVELLFSKSFVWCITSPEKKGRNTKASTVSSVSRDGVRQRTLASVPARGDATLHLPLRAQEPQLHHKYIETKVNAEGLLTCCMWVTFTLTLACWHASSKQLRLHHLHHSPGLASHAPENDIHTQHELYVRYNIHS